MLNQSAIYYGREALVLSEEKPINTRLAKGHVFLSFVSDKGETSNLVILKLTPQAAQRFARQLLGAIPNSTEAARLDLSTS